MAKKIILTERQVKKLIEVRVNDFNIEDIAKKIGSIECTGEDLKYLVTNILNDYGYEDVKVIFLGHEEETKNLRYIAYTEGPMIVYKTKSIVSPEDKPCLSIYDVRIYREV